MDFTDSRFSTIQFLTTTTVITNTTTGNMINYHTVVFLKPATTRAGFYDLTARLVAGNHTRLIAFRPLTQMLVINAPNIRAIYKPVAPSPWA